MATFPDDLFETEHQQEIFSAMFGAHIDFKPGNPMRPKLAYRSDSTTSIFLLYVAQGVNWIAVCNSDRDDIINVQDYWPIPSGGVGPGDTLVLMNEFFKDVSYYVNNRKVPPERVT